MKTATKKIPHYYIFRVLLIVSFLYALLIFPYYSILRINQFAAIIPEIETERFEQAIAHGTEHGESIIQIIEKNQAELLSKTIGFFIVIFAILILIAANLPVKLFFRKKRRKKEIPKKLSNYTVRYIRILPAFNTLIIFLPLFFTHIANIFEITALPAYPSDYLIHEKKLHYVHIIASILIAIFIYYWQKNRLQFVYIEHVYSPETLSRISYSKHRSKISHYFLTVNLITILFPIIMVAFYLSTSISQFSQFDMPDFSEEQKEVLFNNTLTLQKVLSPEEYMNYGFYINADNSLIMIWGLIQSTLSALIFLSFFIFWTTRLVVKPVNELLAGIKSTGKESMGFQNIVRSNDEIGQLTAEYNKMSERLKQYFDEVSDLNQNLEKKVIERTKTINEQKKEIEESRDKLVNKNTEIEAQNEEIKQQRDILSHQKKEITDSIFYAQRIQNAVMPENSIFDKAQTLIFFKPRDIVSGDFYYFNQSNGLKIFAAADCTGHGVPGAFMSMLGISFLNEIVKTSTTKPSDILEQLRRQVKNSLRQTTQNARQKDGIDIALCTLDEKNKTLQFAGAYNPLIIIRNKTIIEHKAVKNPIGIYMKEKPFENICINLQKNDMIYLFSNGYPDQFGGKHSRKFQSKHFKELLRSIAHKEIDEQIARLESTLENWQGKLEQTDDIIIIGVKIL